METLALDNKLNINLNDSLDVGLLNSSKDNRDKAINYSFLSGSENLNNNSDLENSIIETLNLKINNNVKEKFGMGPEFIDELPLSPDCSK
jgi:hypothetical protein